MQIVSSVLKSVKNFLREYSALKPRATVIGFLANSGETGPSWREVDIALPASQPPQCISGEYHINGSRTHGSRTHGVAHAPQTFDHYLVNW
jgi:hypothetical protein